MTLRRLAPTKLATQMLLVLIVTILLVFGSSIFITIRAHQISDQYQRDRLAAERVGDLVSAITVVAAGERRQIARGASTRTTAVRVENSPAVAATAADQRSMALMDLVQAETRLSDIRVSVLSGADPDAAADPRTAGRNREVIAISVPVSDRQWLNFNSRPPMTRFTRSEQTFLKQVFAFTILAVTTVVWFFLRRITQPVSALSDAARRFAAGENEVELAERGPEELREAARAFNYLQAEVSRFEQERKRTVAAVGHDLRTPLTSLRIQVESIDDDALRDRLIAAIEQAASMAEGLILYAKSGIEEAQTSDVNLAHIAREICDELGTNLKVLSEPVIKGGQVSLTRAVRNLVQNARQYGGETDVTVTRDGKKAILTVEDNGPGIDPNLMDQIFEPFVRGDSSRNSEQAGAGLGLTSAKDIITAHGGTIELHNKTAGGLVVIVELPMPT